MFPAIGGYDGFNTVEKFSPNKMERFGLNTVERFDPRVGSWDYVASMSNCKYGAVAAVLKGKIYASGGYNGSEHLKIVEMFRIRYFLKDNICPLTAMISDLMHGALALQ